MRPWIHRSLLAFLGVGLTLLLCEAVLRLTGSGVTVLKRSGLHTWDPQAGWICLPNVDALFELPGSFRVRVRSNSRGLRDEEISLAPAPGSKRIVVLGDSFA